MAGTYVIHNIIWANEKIDMSVYRWLSAHAMFDIKWFVTFVGAAFERSDDTLNIKRELGNKNLPKNK